MSIQRIISYKLSDTDCSITGAQFASDYDRVLTRKFQGAVSFPIIFLRNYFIIPWATLTLIEMSKLVWGSAKC